MKKYLQLLLSIWLISVMHQMNGQETPVPVSEVIESMNEYIETGEAFYNKKEYKKATDQALEGYRIAKILNNNYGEASACLLLSRIYRLEKNYYESLEFGLRSLHASKKTGPQSELTALLSLIHLYSDWGAWQKVLECIRQASELSANDPALQRTLNIEKYHASIALNKNQQAIWILEDLCLNSNIREKKYFISELIRLKRLKGETGSALKLATELRNLLEVEGTDEEKSACENNIGSIYLDLMEFSFAIVHCENALHLKSDESTATAAILINLASALFKDKQPSRALITLELADGIYNKYPSPKEHSLVLALKSRILSSLGDLSNAIIHANEALQLAQKTDDLILQSEIYGLLASLTKKTGDSLISNEFRNKSQLLLSQAEKSDDEDKIQYAEKLLSISNKEKLVLNSIAAAEQESQRLKEELEQTNEAKKMAELEYEKELKEAALENEQSARENAIKELELVKAALDAEQQMRTISELEKERTEQKLKVNELSLAENENEKRLQSLRNQNELLESQKRLKEAESEKEAVSRKIRNLFLIFLLFTTIIATLGFLITRKKNNIIRSSNSRVKEINEVLKGQNEEILSSIQFARNFQDTIIPVEETIQNHIRNSFLIYEPLDIVSGDIPFIVRRENCLYIGAIDCIGHGVPAAMLSFMAYYNLNELIQEKPDIPCGEMLLLLHERLADSLKKRYANPNFASGVDIGLCRVQLDTLKIQYSGANLPLVIVNPQGAEKIAGDYHSVGDIFVKSVIGFSTHERQLHHQDRIFLLSDGFIHQMGGMEGHKKFSMKRLLGLLQNLHAEPMQMVRQQLVAAFKEWKGKASQTDDIVLIGIELNQTH